jgi:hypothetical protein
LRKLRKERGRMRGSVSKKRKRKLRGGSKRGLQR